MRTRWGYGAYGPTKKEFTGPATGRRAVTDFAPDPAARGPHRDVLMSLVHSCGITGSAASHIRSEFVEPYRQAHSKTKDTEVLISVVGRCADNRHPFAYLSVPLTTGRSFIELLARRDGAPVDPERVRNDRNSAVAHNRRRAHEAAARLRAILSGMVIDPSRFADVPGWEQADYHAFWVMVIEQYSEKIFFLDGWQYSVGCTIEFGTAVQLGLPMLTNHLAPLDAVTGKRLVLAAIDEYAAAGLDTEPLREALSIAENAAAEVQSAGEAD
jgi:Domain of unknown function (DUF4406)